MIPLKKRETKLLVSIHGWSSIILGLLLYAVVLTGTVAVLAKEIGHWSASTPIQEVPFSYPINDIVHKLSKKVGRAYREDVNVSINFDGNMGVFFHKHFKNAKGFTRDRGVLFIVDPKTGNILERKEATSFELRNSDQVTTLMRFLIDTHVRLYMPMPWGLLVTGILGMVMMLSAVTGLFIHRHLLRDIFTLRKREKSVLEKRDKHSVAASWGLPFAFLLAFTGCFFSFAGSFGIPALAMVAFGGNQAELVRTVMGSNFLRPGKRIKTDNLDLMLQASQKRSGSIARGVSVEHFGRKNAVVTITHKPKFGGLEGKTLQYNGVDGTFKRELPRVGIVPSMGAKIVTIIAPLHFGNFAGIFSKAIWVALGFSSCYIILSGLTLWTRRREGKTGWRIFERVVHVFGLGLPIAIVGSAISFFVFLGTPAVVKATPLGFVFALAIVFLAAIFLNSHRLETYLWSVLGLTLVSLPIFRFLSSDLGWITAFGQGAITVIALDILLIFSGFLCLRLGLKKTVSPAISALQTS